MVLRERLAQLVLTVPRVKRVTWDNRVRQEKKEKLDLRERKVLWETLDLLVFEEWRGNLAKLGKKAKQGQRAQKVISVTLERPDRWVKLAPQVLLGRRDQEGQLAMWGLLVEWDSKENLALLVMRVIRDPRAQ